MENGRLPKLAFSTSRRSAKMFVDYLKGGYEIATGRGPSCD
jgi:hypothetical protein